MRRCTIAWTLMLLGLAQSAAAASSSSIDLQLFMPAPGATNFLTTESGEVQAPWSLSFGAAAIYGRNLLRLDLDQANAPTRVIGTVVGSRFDFNLMAALGLWNRFEVGLAIPLVSSGGYDAQAFGTQSINLAPRGLRSFSLGDVRLVPKVNIINLNEGAFALAFVPMFVLPTSSSAAFAGEGRVTPMPLFALSSRLHPVRLGLDLGYRWRNKVNLLQNSSALNQISISSELFFRAAIAVELAHPNDRPIEFIGEIIGYTPFKHPFTLGLNPTARRFSRINSPVEGNIALRVAISNLTFTLGGGGGLSSGYGAPQPRLFLSGAYYSGKTILPDMDNDGIPDDLDKCPDRPEDFDKFEDADGCPEIDNDKDGVLDDDDQCPLEPEDRDGFEDEDGCPDLDNDRDGIPDAIDGCPNEPEDMDGIHDDDGCPEVDNDKDGIPDTEDKCPNEPEDMDGFEDLDGCPELDNDKDGLPDLNDLCPNVPEDKDGVHDDDGCPEDNDNDGIPDDLDKCPNEPENYNGVEDTDGCPEKNGPKSLVQVTDEKIDITEAVYFKTGSAIILAKSYPMLDQIVAVLKNYRHITKVRIDGHTDNQGARLKNIKLSADRAESVRRYLGDKGIARERLAAAGLGPDRPIATNKTPLGREKNRRVEFVIVGQKPIGEEVKQAPPLVPSVKPAEIKMDLPGTSAAPPAAPPGPSLFDMNAPPTAAPGAAPAAPGPAKKHRGKKKDKIEFGF